MTVSTHRGTVSGSTITHNGGTILNGGNIDSTTPFVAKSPVEIVDGRKVVGSQLAPNAAAVGGEGTLSEHQPGLAIANSSGTFGYNPNSPNVTRSSSDAGFVIRSGVVNKISGVSGLNPLLSGGSDTTSRFGGNIHVPNGIHKYSRKGTWATTIFDAYGGNLLQSDGTAKAGITGRGSDASLATDNAATPTRAIPGEMTLLFNFVTFTTNNLDYSAITGA